MRRSLAAALFLGLLGLRVVSGAEGPSYRVIVNPKNQATALDRKLLTQIFLKKTTHWSDGTLARPVDLDTDSPTRKRFSEDVLNRSVAAVKSYWQQKIFGGRDIPPPELDSDEDVVKFVLKHPGAIGYVAASASTGAAKVVGVK